MSQITSPRLREEIAAAARALYARLTTEAPEVPWSEATPVIKEYAPEMPMFPDAESSFRATVGLKVRYNGAEYGAFMAVLRDEERNSLNDYLFFMPQPAPNFPYPLTPEEGEQVARAVYARANARRAGGEWHTIAPGAHKMRIRATAYLYPVEGGHLYVRQYQVPRHLLPYVAARQSGEVGQDLVIYYLPGEVQEDEEGQLWAAGLTLAAADQEGLLSAPTYALSLTVQGILEEVDG